MAPLDWDTDEGLEKITKFCRGGFPVRQGIERLRNAHDTDRRVEYFRGEKLMMCLLGELDADEARRTARGSRVDAAGRTRAERSGIWAAQ